MVAAGDTAFDVCPVTFPTPWSIVSEVALATVHDSVDVPPARIDAGLAVNELITGGLVTVTVAVAVTLPVLLLAVKVYVVVAAGDTAYDVCPVTAPTPWSIPNVAALAIVHDNVAVCPTAMLPGVALKLPILGFTPFAFEPLPELKRASAKSAFELITAPPAATICPSGCTAIADTPSDWTPKMLVNLPPVPKVVSSAPLLL